MSSGGLILSTDEIVLKNAVDSALKAAGGQDAAAASTVAGRSQLQRCQSHEHRDSITIRDAVIVDRSGAHVEGHPFILRAYAQQLGFGLHAQPVARTGGGNWLKHIGALSSEAGDVIAKMSAGLADGVLTATEIRESGLRADACQLMEIAAALIAELDAVEGER